MHLERQAGYDWTGGSKGAEFDIPPVVAVGLVGLAGNTSSIRQEEGGGNIT
jgi:hypothetical protein